MRQGGESQGVQVVRQGEPTLYHCNFNRLYCFGRHNVPSANSHTSPCRRTRPFLFSPLAHLPTRGPSGQTWWHKTSFALARLRPSSEYADGLLIESRLANPTAIALNPMEENQSKIPKSPMYIYYIWYIYSYNRYLYYIYKYKYAL